MEFERYEMRFRVTASRSPMSTLLNERWLAKVEIDGAEGVNYDPSQLLAGTGDNALEATRRALAALAQQSTYQELVIETALMAGTRTASTRPNPLLRSGPGVDPELDRGTPVKTPKVVEGQEQ